MDASATSRSGKQRHPLVTVGALVALLVILSLLDHFVGLPAQQRESPSTDPAQPALTEADDDPNLTWDVRASDCTTTIGVESLQTAVNSAVPGDVICVNPGLYTDNAIGRPRNQLEIHHRSGTSQSPITLRAVERHSTTIPRVEFLKAQWWIIDGFEVNGYGTNKDEVVRFLDGANYNKLADLFIHHVAQGIGVKGGYKNQIEDSLLEETYAGDSTDAHCIFIDGGAGTVVRNNVLHNCRGDGIQLGYYSANPEYDDNRDTLIEGNHFYVDAEVAACAENALDIKRGSGGANYVVVRDNTMHGFRSSGGVCGSTGSGGEAIVVHKGAENVILERNRIFDSVYAFRFIQARNVYVQNNLVYDIRGAQGSTAAVQLHYVNNVQIYHNAFVNCSAWLIYHQSDRGSIQNNLFHNCGGYHADSSLNSAAFGYNGWFGNTTPVAGSGDISGSDPQLGMDYSLSAGSSLRDRGLDVGIIIDFNGNSRMSGSEFVGGQPDIGAFEYGSGMSLPRQRYPED